MSGQREPPHTVATILSVAELVTQAIPRDVPIDAFHCVGMASIAGVTCFAFSTEYEEIDELQTLVMFQSGGGDYDTPEVLPYNDSKEAVCLRTSLLESCVSALCGGQEVFVHAWAQCDHPSLHVLDLVSLSGSVLRRLDCHDTPLAYNAQSDLILAANGFGFVSIHRLGAHTRYIEKMLDCTRVISAAAVGRGFAVLCSDGPTTSFVQVLSEALDNGLRIPFALGVGESIDSIAVLGQRLFVVVSMVNSSRMGNTRISAYSLLSGTLVMSWPISGDHSVRIYADSSKLHAVYNSCGIARVQTYALGWSLSALFARSLGMAPVHVARKRHSAPLCIESQQRVDIAHKAVALVSCPEAANLVAEPSVRIDALSYIDRLMDTVGVLGCDREFAWQCVGVVAFEEKLYCAVNFCGGDGLNDALPIAVIAERDSWPQVNAYDTLHLSADPAPLPHCSDVVCGLWISTTLDAVPTVYVLDGFGHIRGHPISDVDDELCYAFPVTAPARGFNPRSGVVACVEGLVMSLYDIKDNAGNNCLLRKRLGFYPNGIIHMDDEYVVMRAHSNCERIVVLSPTLELLTDFAVVHMYPAEEVINIAVLDGLIYVALRSDWAHMDGRMLVYSTAGKFVCCWDLEKAAIPWVHAHGKKLYVVYHANAYDDNADSIGGTTHVRTYSFPWESSSERRALVRFLTQPDFAAASAASADHKRAAVPAPDETALLLGLARGVQRLCPLEPGPIAHSVALFL
jgi:hypothetical protein